MEFEFRGDKLIEISLIWTSHEILIKANLSFNFNFLEFLKGP